MSPRIGPRFLLSAIGCSLLKRDDVSICSSFLSSRTSLLPPLLANLPSRGAIFHRCVYARTRSTGRERRGRGSGGGGGEWGKSKSRGSRVASGSGTDLSTGCYLVTRRGLRLYDSPAWMMLSPMVSALSRHGRALTCR